MPRRSTISGIEGIDAPNVTKHSAPERHDSGSSRPGKNSTSQMDCSDPSMSNGGVYFADISNRKEAAQKERSIEEEVEEEEKEVKRSDEIIRRDRSCNAI